MEANVSDTINLAGKDIIVDHVTTQDGADAFSALQLMNAKRNRNGVDSITGGTCRIGARASGTTLEIYAYNPLNDYSVDFGDDYYVNTGYVDCNGQSCPVYIPGKHISFPVTGGQFKQGTWAIIIYKATALDEVWSVKVAIAEPDNSTPPVMEWSDTLGGSVTIDTSVWVIGFFTFSSLDGVYNLFVNQNGTTPMSFLKDRFMQVINDCDGVDTDDFTDWAVAMKCDAIFKRLAVLEAFVGNLRAQNLQVGEDGNGFCFQALTNDGQNNKVFNVKYGNNSLFRVDISTGRIYFGTGFWYNPSDLAIHSVGDGVVILADGSMEINNGSYKSDLICPSFRSTPRPGTPISPTVVNLSGSAQNQGSSLISTFPNTMSIRPCTHSGDSRVAYMDHTVLRDHGYGLRDDTFYFYNSSMTKVGEIIYAATYPSYLSTWSNTSFTLTVGTVTQVTFRLVDNSDSNPQLSIGTDPSSLLKGELYYVADGGGTGTLHVKL